VAQMKMFLTRMGMGSKIVVSGDTTQVDLPSHTRSGLVDGVGRLQGRRLLRGAADRGGHRPHAWCKTSSAPTKTSRGGSDRTAKKHIVSAMQNGYKTNPITASRRAGAAPQHVDRFVESLQRAEVLCGSRCALPRRW